MNSEKLQAALSRLERTKLLATASRVARFKLGAGLEYASAANVSGVRNRSFSFSRRLDSRTIFAVDAAYGITRKAGAWTGADKPLIARCQSVMKAAGVPRAEIASVRAVAELGASSERLADGAYRVPEQKLLCKVARARRAVKGLPVWSSSVTLGLTRAGTVGRFELHWPDLPAGIINEADILRALLKRGFEPPPMPGAKVESMQAGIIHSPAVAFFMDIAAVIRVVYQGDDPSIGRKPALYLDRHGQSITAPRDIASSPHEMKPRAAPGYSKGRA